MFPALVLMKSCRYAPGANLRVWLVAMVSIGLVSTSRAAGSQDGARLDSLTVEQWREDIGVLEREMRARHANLYHTVSPTRFDQSVRNLKRRLPGLTALQIVLGIERLVASVRDGHTRVMDNRLKFRGYPLRVYWYQDGLFLQAATREHADAVGARVTRMGKAAIDDAVSSIANIVPRDNDFSLRERVPWRLVTPEILLGLGLIENMDRVPIELERNGRRWSIEVVPLAVAPGECQGLLQPVPSDWVDAHGAGELPLWLRNPCSAYWFQYLDESRTLYVQVNEVQNRGPTSFAGFFERVFAVADSVDPARFVLDLRLNGGGDLSLLRPAIVGLIQRKAINQRGKLFVVIGRRTFSAAQYWVDELEKYAEPVFVGEPTAEAVNFYSDAEVFELPNSHIRVGVSTLRWQPMPPWQDRLYTQPDLAAELTSSDYAANRDPALEAILRYQPPRK
jgi:hypothetical protein